VKYGGNYEFFAEQKELAMNALDHDVKSKEKELRKAREKEKEALERQNKLNARGKKKQEKAGIPKILMGGLKNKAEGSSGKLKAVHEEKISGIRMSLHDLRTNLPEIDQMKFGFEESSLHIGKTLVEAKEVNLKINGRNLWHQNLNFRIKSGDRIALKGTNGSGKTSLINLIIGNRQPTSGEISRANFNYVYVDQDYSLIKTEMKVYDMAQSFNHSGLQEHEIKIRLNRFLFSKDTWDKSCMFLSGGERMRLLLCCLNIQSQAPDIIILDEPTNNIDIQNIQILTTAIQSYQGCLIVVSHDQYFLNEINIQETIQLG
jgi:ATPase subunit of ABC transporter with duplicated ATPase domains